MSGSDGEVGVVNQAIRALLVEDNATDVLLLREAFADLSDFAIAISQVERLVEAVACLEDQTFDIVLLDLGLPDSQGMETFVRLHQHAPDIPIVVLTALADEAVGVKAMQEGAQDYLVKQQVGAPLLGRAVRYAIERYHLREQLEQSRQREQREREFRHMDRLSSYPGTTVTAQIYTGGSLREIAPEEFDKLVISLTGILDQAFDQRIFKMDQCSYARELRTLSDHLGALRVGPRDVIEVHSNALKKKIDNLPHQKAQVYVEEGRMIVLELMGYLASYYRRYCPGFASRGEGYE